MASLGSAYLMQLTCHAGQELGARSWNLEVRRPRPRCWEWKRKLTAKRGRAELVPTERMSQIGMNRSHFETNRTGVSPSRSGVI
jgi:hypothetical protein